MIASRNDEGDAYSNELFDLEADPGETNDIAKGNPEIVQRLSKALQKAEANGPPGLCRSSQTNTVVREPTALAAGGCWSES